MLPRTLVRKALTAWLRHRVPPSDADPGFVDIYGTRVPSWTCQVCGRRRPDDRIRVFSRRYDLLTGQPASRVEEAVTVHVRYCVDSCEAGAADVAERMTEPLRQSFRNRRAVSRIVRG